MLVECVICYEHLQSSEAIYHTPCGHVFHHSCLTRWFKRSKTCPECREKIPERKISRLYLNFVNDPATVDAAMTSNFQTKISRLNHELLIKEIEIIESNSNNTKLTALLKSKESEIYNLQTSMFHAKEYQELSNNIIGEQRKELEEVKKDIARITKEKDDILSSNGSWEKVSQMFHGITDHNTLVEMISVMKSELATCTNSRWELQRTVIKLQQELSEVSEARMFCATERTKKSAYSASTDSREIESNLAAMEIEKLRLQRRVEELEDMVNFGVQPDNFVGPKVLQANPVTPYNSVPFKKRKVDTSGITDGPTTTIDVIDLTVEPVQPLIDLTKDTVESPIISAPSSCVDISSNSSLTTSLES